MNRSQHRNNHYSKEEPPVILLAFANEQDDVDGYLRHLADEVRQLRESLEKAERAGLCEVVLLPNATLEEILKKFRDYRDRIGVFHFGGHAGSFGLLLERHGGRSEQYDVEKLSEFLGATSSPQLVFLNACSTQPHAEGLLAVAPLVIATSQDVGDKVATNFADQFYRSLATGATIRGAYNEAAIVVQAEYGNEPDDLRQPSAARNPSSRMPWQLYVRPGAKKAKEWDLPTAVDDPLFDLPPLPDGMDLPPDPYRSLQRFEREHAPIFFGRGAEIRNLFQHLTGPKTAPIVLYYGQSGVGKSSLLDAGLLPRLERDHRVEYVRRTQEIGLLGSLRLAIHADSSDDTDLGAGWCAREAANDRPLMIVLDQIEECFTQADSFNPTEFTDFLEALQKLFAGREQRPQGRLILGFRKEWLAEIKDQLSKYNLSNSEIFLERLSTQGVIEAVVGPTSEGALRNHYHLTMADELPPRIANDLMTDRGSAVAPMLQILLDKLWHRAKAEKYEKPYIDEKLYLDLKNEGLLLDDFLTQQLNTLAHEEPEASRSGLILDLLALHTTPLRTAKQYQVAEIATVYEHQKDMLPALLAKCRALYLLVDPAENRPQAAPESRLAHDTLAPLVRQRFDESDAPGQRARRILESRVIGDRDELDLQPLSSADLAVVEAGEGGMRDWHDSEKELVNVSRQAVEARKAEEEAVRQRELENQRRLAEEQHKVAEEQRKRAEEQEAAVIKVRRRLMAAVVLGVLAVGAAIVAIALGIRAERNATLAEQNEATAIAAQATAVAERAIAETERAEAERQRNIALARQLAAESLVALEIDPESAMQLAMQAITITTTMQESPLPEAISALHHAEQASRVEEVATLHNARVHDVAYSANGNQLISSGFDGIANLWDLGSENLVTALPREGAPLTSAKLNAAGSKAYLTDLTGNLEVWDLTSSQLLNDYPQQIHDGAIIDSDLSVDDQVLTTTGRDKKTRIIDLTTGKVQTMPVDNVGCGVAFNADGTKLATGDMGGQIYVWDVATLEETHKFYHGSERNEACAVAFSPDSTILATGGSDTITKLWSVESSALLTTMAHHTDTIYRLVFSPHGELLASAGLDNEINIYDVFSGRLLYTLHGHKGPLQAVTFSPEGDQLASADEAGAVRLWDTSFGYHSDIIGGVSFSPDGTLYASFGQGGKVKLWDSQSEQLLFQFDVGAPVWNVAIHPEQPWLATIGGNNKVQIWDIDIGKQITETSVSAAEAGGIAYSPDGQLLAVAGDEGVVLWNTQSGEQVDSFSTPEKNYGVVFSPDGTSLAVANEDRTVRVWSLSDGESKFELSHQPNNAQIFSVAFSPDGGLLATAGSDAKVSLWDAITGEKVGEVEGHAASIFDVEFSPNGALISTASAEPSVRIWELSEMSGGSIGGENILTFSDFDQIVFAAHFSPNGKEVVAGGADQLIRRYTLALDELMTDVEQRLRNLEND